MRSLNVAQEEQAPHGLQLHPQAAAPFSPASARAIDTGRVDGVNWTSCVCTEFCMDLYGLVGIVAGASANCRALCRAGVGEVEQTICHQRRPPAPDATHSPPPCRIEPSSLPAPQA